MQRAQDTGVRNSSKSKASDGENLIETTASDDLDQDIELKAIESKSMNDNDDETMLLTSPEDETSLTNAGSEVKSVTNDDLHEGKEISSLPQQTQKPRRLLKLLNRCSLFAVGMAILVVGGVSSNFHPYIDPGEYENCSITEHLNESRLLNGLMETEQTVNLSPTPTCASEVTSFNPDILKTISKPKTAKHYRSSISNLLFISPTPTK